MGTCPSLGRSCRPARPEAWFCDSEPLDVAVGLQRGEEYVEKPQAHKEPSCGQLAATRAAQLPAQVGPPAVQEHADAHEREDGEEGDGEGQRAGRHVKFLSLQGPVDGGHGPGQANAQEDVDGVAARDVADGGVCVHVLDGSRFAGKRIWKEAETVRAGGEAEMGGPSVERGRKAAGAGRLSLGSERQGPGGYSLFPC